MDGWMDDICSFFKTGTDMEFLALYYLCLSIFGDPRHPDHKSGVPGNVRFSSFLFVREELLLYSLVFVQEKPRVLNVEGFLFLFVCFNKVLYRKKCFLFTRYIIVTSKFHQD